MTDDLVQFLRDRLDEDEVAAVAAKPGPWHADGGSVYATHPTDEIVSYTNSAEHIARHNPPRVLADVEAKREVLRVAAAAHDYFETFTSGFGAAMEQVLRLLALPHADHPDYRDEWRP
ncbi:hypothetical protein GCM10010331_48820 [Streptomyces xanthochromogenes]|uniref:DUF6221 family protein n=1 Tax=Streptomyces xanthochromogenes TaxID=67384 RepID=UPI001674E1FE|nr:DUF6221 family protein [Streptomyces xanthochromogenes]GHB55242.1 hypothetical protein GCM10010331_48820 [Streptomyces xanthochromogenes]